MEIMKKVKEYRMLIVGIVVGLIVFGGGVYATTIGATNVSYSNASSGMYSNTVQGAIDELYNDSKKNTDFIKNLATGYAHDVFLQHYNQPCTIDHQCTYLDLALNHGMSTCVFNCTKTKKADECVNECYGMMCSKDNDVMKNLNQGCTDKCSGNKLCYDTCFSKAVDSDECIEFYKKDSSS